MDSLDSQVIVPQDFLRVDLLMKRSVHKFLIVKLPRGRLFRLRRAAIGLKSQEVLVRVP